MSKFASNQKQKLKHQNKLSLSQIRKALCWYLWLFFRFISENLGGYIGASLGGFTFDKIGFVNGTTVVIGLQVRALSREITFLSGTFIALIGFRYQHQPFSDSLSKQIYIPRPQCRVVCGYSKLKMSIASKFLRTIRSLFQFVALLAIPLMWKLNKNQKPVGLASRSSQQLSVEDTNERTKLIGHNNSCNNNDNNIRNGGYKSTETA